MVGCTQCGTENRAGRKFCAGCGRSLALPCPACGAANEPGERFCGECGAPLGVDEPAAAPVQPVAERRLVSVLFADLVGFTPLSESRDPEEVRELLSRYFDTCRRLVELYGGTVEKFIGDAIMAVWGTPIAQEDDAERAVRAALDLVAAVSSLGDEVGAPDLRARAGVLSGEAAVTVGAVGEGMVAGDLVNTAARIQADAEPGTVLVGESTRRASEAAIVFEDAGAHALKGKSEPVQLYRAVRVAAARGGALRSTGLEAPFVGRERELRLVKEHFHAAAEQSRAQLVSVTGIAGIGKSRLAWEFFKYVDGLAEEAWWHRGRCLAYGEGVAYWALAEMVRARAGILEGEEPAGARAKLATCAAEHVPDPEERAWVEPRLANLLGLEERTDSDRPDLFAAWRLFFERLSDSHPVVLVFEDLQWADHALIAFVEYLLEWSSAQRMYVLCLARPELADQSPDFGRSVRNASTLALEPLSDTLMTELLEGYVPGLPDEVRTQVLARAQGVPLYAVETVRMLLDRGLLVQEGSVYRPAGAIETLDVPETLHALVAARLDGLAPEERRVVQDACVLGKTFTKEALGALTGRDEAELQPLLAGLVRKEVFSAQADPRGALAGQYGFLQELLRQVAYETLSRRDRKTRHLAAVAALERSFPGVEQDVPEVLATHLLAAFEAAPDDPDAGEIRGRARAALAHAGERAASLAAPEEGQRYLEQAVELADDDATRAELLVRAGGFARHAARMADARRLYEQGIALYEQLGDMQQVARAGVDLGDVDVADGRLEEAAARFAAVLPTLEAGGPSEALAMTLSQLARIQSLGGDRQGAFDTLERSLRISEALALDEPFVQALTTKGMTLIHEGRWREARLLLEGAVVRARESELHDAWWRAMNNLAVVFQSTDELEDSLRLAEEMEAAARLRGDRELLATARFGKTFLLVELGRWDEVTAVLADDDGLASTFARAGRLEAAVVHCERGNVQAAARLLDEHAWARETELDEWIAVFAAVESRVLRAAGRGAAALEAAERGLSSEDNWTHGGSGPFLCLVESLEAALELGDIDRAEELLSGAEQLPARGLTPRIRAERARFRARLDLARGRDIDADRLFREAEENFEGAKLAFRLAVVQLEHAEWLAGVGRGDEAKPLLDETRATFANLEAAPWLERLERVATPAGVPA